MKQLVGTLTELETKRKTRVIVNEKPILVVVHDGKVYALNDKCPHKGAPLSPGKLDGSILQCKEHGLQIDVTTGQVVMGLKAKLLVPHKDSQSIRTYKTIVEDGSVYIDL